MAVAGVTTWALYRVALVRERGRLIEVVRSQARLMEAVARFDARNTQPGEAESAFAATMGQVREAHAEFLGFGETGEFAVAVRHGAEMLYLTPLRYASSNSLRIPFGGALGQPMSRALAGLSGAMIGADYRGETVLAAYEPVAALSVGVVAKIDRSEVRAPYVRVTLYVGGGLLLVLAVVTVLSRRLAEPILSRLMTSEGQLRHLIDTSRAPILVVRADGRFLRVNGAFTALLGYSVVELARLQDRQLFVDSARHTEFLERLRQDGIVRDFDAQLRKKDGTGVLCNLAFSALRSSKRDVLTYFGIVNDVTERRRIEGMSSRIRDEERARIGRDLHDTLGQVLTGIGLVLQGIQKKTDKGTTVSRDDILAVRELVKHAAVQTRYVARGLLPIQGRQDLGAALEDLAALTERLYGVVCSTHVDGEVETPQRLSAEHLYHIAQEAVTNAVRHGEAGKVDIELRDCDGDVELAVTDDGVGFAPDESGAGIWLRIMEYRAAVIGGRLEVKPRADGGTVVRCLVPGAAASRS